MANNIIEEIENYLNYQDEINGNILYFNKLENQNQTELKNEVKISTATVNETEKEYLMNEQKKETKIEKVENISTIDTNWKDLTDLSDLRKSISKCTNCSLGFSRTNFVFGEGNPNADIMLIGEAPGADEDEQGMPFVGRAGQLLTKIIEAINLKREEVFICNILKCRPPGNRKPLVSEVDECEQYLKKQIEIVKPKFILLLGITAAETLLKMTVKMGIMRGKTFQYEGIETLITYHPAALLRNPNWKPLVWEDVKLLRRLYDEYLINKEKK